MSNRNPSVRATLCVIGLALAFAVEAAAQFDVGAYQQFMDANRGLSADGLLSLYNADTFLDSAGSPGIDSALYGAAVDEHYQLTEGERQAISRNGFVVSERLTYNSFGAAYLDIYHADLPVYVSADSILHAMHASYDAILMNLEIAVLIPALVDLTQALRQQVRTLDERYADEPGMQVMLRDLDVYISTGRRMLVPQSESIYPETQQTVDELVALIEAEGAAEYPLFAEVPRFIDFSQFTPRGHYTTDIWAGPGVPTLAQYFKAMMWFGRTEVYLTAPEAPGAGPTEQDVQRQTILAKLTMEAVEAAGMDGLLDDMERTLRSIVGPSDNVTPADLRSLVVATGIRDAAALLDPVTWKAFQATLLEQPYASQRILSQMLAGNDAGPPSEPASAFLLFGQRFIIDSFITGNVVYDKIEGGVRRMSPSSLDVLFALGNDSAAQLLVPELQQFHYAPNLASLRYLVDEYQTETWDDSLYAGWLNSIRALNPPADRSQFPTFMQTAAWWQKTMTTQLASWAELRHDHLLYAKQSYSAIPACSYPRSFVEPVPDFYDAVARFAGNASRSFGAVSIGGVRAAGGATSYFDGLESTAQRLAIIARKELDDIALSDGEKTWLSQMISEFPGCTTSYNGWYPSLYYDGAGWGEDGQNFLARDYVVADVHTSPADEGGAIVGWVMHAGTGPINLAVMVCDFDREDTHVVVGPVSSYYERVTANFRRMTDQEWRVEYATTPSYRPDFVDVYLANAAGSTASEGITLFTREGPQTVGVEARGKMLLPLAQVKRTALLQNFPNPFNPETWIPFELAISADVTITVYDLAGTAVRTFELGAQPAGVYARRDGAAYWDGRNDTGEPVGSGVYYYTMQAGEHAATRRMVLLK